MEIKLTQKEYEYLLEHKRVNESMIIGKSKITIDLDEDFVLDLHDWVSDQLQIVGFDENYELNKKGEILDNLIDVFNI